MALPGGGRDEPPVTVRQGVANLVGLGLLMARLVLTGLWQWSIHRATAQR